MSRRQKYSLRTLTPDERQWLQCIARSTREPTTHVVRAKQMPAVAAGHSSIASAALSGRRSGDTDSLLQIPKNPVLLETHEGSDNCTHWPIR